jgi:hypothetical protein
MSEIRMTQHAPRWTGRLPVVRIFTRRGPKRSRRRMLMAAMLWLTLISAGGVSASTVLDGELCNISEDEVIESDVFVLCNDLVVYGEIHGHLIGAARTAAIYGDVSGSIYLLAGQFDMHGSVGRDLHSAGIVLHVYESTEFEAGSSLLAANLSNRIDAGTEIPGSLISIGYQLIADGDVGREVSFWGSALTIGGHVQGGVTATVGDSDSSGAARQIETLLIPFRFDVELIDPGLILSETGSVDGILSYKGPTAGIIDGETSRIVFDSTGETPIVASTPVEAARGLGLYFEEVFRDWLTLVVIGAVGLLLVPRVLLSPLRPLQLRPLSTLGVGMLSFILSFPIVLIIALISLIIVIVLSLLPVDQIAMIGGVVLGLANIGGASVFYFAAIFIARIIVGLAIGRLMLRLVRHDDYNLRDQFISLAVGLWALVMLTNIPIVGLVFTAIALFLGLGALLSVLRVQYERFREAGIPPTPTEMYAGPRGQVIRYLPEPRIAETDPASTQPSRGERSTIPQPRSRVGLEDLPPGFNWWED